MIISITGKPCSGKTTISDVLKKKYSFDVIKMGDLFKAEAARRGMSSSEFSEFRVKDPSFDFYIDQQIVPTAEKLKDKRVIFDSRVAFHFLPESFKIFITLDEDEMVRRLLNSDRTGMEKYSDQKQARASLNQRCENDIKRYKKIYNFDLENMDNYDLVIDSTNRTPEDIADEIYEKCVKFYNKKS